MSKQSLAAPRRSDFSRDPTLNEAGIATKVAPTTPTKQSGFTLIEIMVALAIVAIALAASITAVSSSSAALSHVEEKRFAAWVAQNHLNTLRLQSAWPDTGTENIKVKLGGHRWRIDEKVTTTTEKNMVRMDVKVWSLGEDDTQEDEPVITVTGFLPNPEIGIDD